MEIFISETPLLRYLQLYYHGFGRISSKKPLTLTTKSVKVSLSNRRGAPPWRCASAMHTAITAITVAVILPAHNRFASWERFLIGTHTAAVRFGPPRFSFSAAGRSAGTRKDGIYGYHFKA
ncbi:hypothetical protein BACCAP_02769 [Pseudoflavonifractor capillosus ATCC 29799]|uniref:Uncharacterized protein n=1 Tax=Pseudoflavonifractor capillosus ATCC 29799 TaxID=411467 RepID=A6NX23_9FIRM|nr:hypothetical protein BACCAP_02769 [Pseudoflavonifractor capillosus ATCC 29799]